MHSSSANLSNGDEVTVSYTFDNDVAKKYGIKFVGKDQSYEVSGLEEIREVDPFDYITVTFSGTAPNVYVDVEVSYSDEIMNYLNFDVDKSSGLSKGDTVVLSVSFDGDLAQEFGCRLTETTKEFVCENVDAYITEGSDIGTTVLGDMQTQTQDTIEAYFAQNADDISVAELTYQGFYFLTAKDQTAWGDKNRVYIVYSGQVSSVDGDFETTTVYFTICFENVIKYADGTDYVDLNSTNIQGSTSLSYGWFSHVKGYENLTSLKNDLVTSQKSDYNDSVFGNLE